MTTDLLFLSVDMKLNRRPRHYIISTLKSASISYFLLYNTIDLKQRRFQISTTVIVIEGVGEFKRHKNTYNYQVGHERKRAAHNTAILQN